MATERDDKPVVNSPAVLRELLSSAITCHMNPEVALLHIMKKYYFKPHVLRKILNEDHIDINFSNLQYEDVTPFVGLEPDERMDDIEIFRLHRSRIPTALFKQIVQDIEIMSIQYGPPFKHETEEATLRFISPIFNHLIAIFGSALRNRTKSIIKGHFTGVEYYFTGTTINSAAILLIEVNLRIGGLPERLDAIAQVIAECNAYDWYNAQQGFSVPIYGILCCNGATFEFFHFNGTTDPYSFKYGLGPNDPLSLRCPFQLPNLEYSSTSRPFIEALRPICEIIFDLLLNSYVSNLKAYDDHPMKKNISKGHSRDKWEEAIRVTVKAQQDFREAEMKRQAQLIDEANSITEKAMASLKSSVNTTPSLYRFESIMSGWDDVNVEKV